MHASMWLVRVIGELFVHATASIAGLRGSTDNV